jgi:hypothetical protein
MSAAVHAQRLAYNEAGAVDPMRFVRTIRCLRASLLAIFVVAQVGAFLCSMTTR